MDVKKTFLNGVIEEEVYIAQPKSFETHEKKSHVCRLKKALYELKQAPRANVLKLRLRLRLGGGLTPTPTRYRLGWLDFNDSVIVKNTLNIYFL